MAHLTLEETILELKNTVFSNQEVEFEKYIQDLSEKSNIPINDLIGFHNLIKIWKKAEDNPTYTYANKKDWSNAEEELIYLYYEIFSKNKVIKNGRLKSKSTSIMFEELSHIFTDRTKQAISFKFYQKRDKYIYDDGQIAIKDLANAEEEEIVELKSSQEVTELEFFSPFDEVDNVKHSLDLDVTTKFDNPKPKEEVDLVETISEIVGNMETVGLNINPFFVSLLEMSQRAVQNSNIDKVEKLERKINILQSELSNEIGKSEQVQRDFLMLLNDFSALKKEIEHFDRLSSKDKLQQLNTFSAKLINMTANTGGVLSMTI
jgi:hypothetical protein